VQLIQLYDTIQSKIYNAQDKQKQVLHNSMLRHVPGHGTMVSGINKTITIIIILKKYNNNNNNNYNYNN